MATVKHELLVSLLSLDIPTSSMRLNCLSSEGGSVEAQIVSLQHQNEAQIAFLAISYQKMPVEPWEGRAERDVSDGPAHRRT
jgi:hypothetical protein